MEDVPSDLGNRIAQAARLAVQMHLETPRSNELVVGGADASRDNAPVFDGVEVVIGGADRSGPSLSIAGSDHGERLEFIRRALGPRRAVRSEAA